jgi:hypothetical protein
MRREMRKALLAHDNLSLSRPQLVFWQSFTELRRRLFRPAINIRPVGFCPKVDQAGGLIVLGDVTCVKKPKICFLLLTHEWRIIFKF